MSEYRDRLRVLHLRLHPDLLPQDAPRHAGPRHPQPDSEHQYLHTIYSIYSIYLYTLSTLSTHYLYIYNDHLSMRPNIYTVSTHYL